jgi:hypothetical protein
MHTWQTSQSLGHALAEVTSLAHIKSPLSNNAAALGHSQSVNVSAFEQVAANSNSQASL